MYRMPQFNTFIQGWGQIGADSNSGLVLVSEIPLLSIVGFINLLLMREERIKSATDGFGARCGRCWQINFVVVYFSDIKLLKI